MKTDIRSTHPLTNLMFSKLKDPNVKPDEVIRTYMRERAEWLKEHDKTMTYKNFSELVDRAFDLEPTRIIT